MYKEGDSIILTKDVTAVALGEHKKLNLPPGTNAAIVLVYGNQDCPDAYEIEAYVKEYKCFALATVKPDAINSMPIIKP